MPPPIPDVPDIRDEMLDREVTALMDAKTKPPGSLGVLEALAVRIAVILGTPRPEPADPHLVVFAGDHGLTAQGVSAYPPEVTPQMVDNFLDGGAAVSVLARQHGIDLTIVDCGVATAMAPRPGLLVAKVGLGTADASESPAMTPTQCAEAVTNGISVARRLPGNALLLGEMGIGNTSSASLLMSRLTRLDIAACTGAGTGLDRDGIRRKTEVLRRVLERHATATEPLAAMAALGGFELATMVGAVLEAAAQRRIIVVDGFVTTAAVLVAAALRPHVLQRCVFAHRSGEFGHAALLKHLEATPILDLGMRLGEGSGAATAWPLIVSACAILRDMATFESAGVSGRESHVG